MGIIFTAVGVGLAGLAWHEGEWAPWFGAAVFGGVGLLLLSTTARVRAEQSRGDRSPVQPASASLTSPEPGAWTFTQIGEEIRRRMLDQPYVVDVGPERIRIHADLADARFLSFAGARQVRQVRGLDVVLVAPGNVIRRDWSRGVESSAGLASFRGEVTMSSGKQVRFERRIESGAPGSGARAAVDYRFDSRELHEPVNEVLQEAGWWQNWYSSMPTEAKVALVLAVLGASAIPLVPLAFLIQWLSQR